MAAENCVICLLGAMDRLWFHQIILFSEPEETLLPHSELSTKNSSNNNSETSLITDQESSVISETAVSQDELSSPESENETTPKERVLSAEKYWRNIRCIGSVRRLQKTMSCKNLGELELEEVCAPTKSASARNCRLNDAELLTQAVQCQTGQR
ncbi:uncharacterized protein Fot_08329 [Forsythia ovata]|uniref:Uncharacterized protein n=1 Tax=Forsythia ovata TaxID=205694 RepID=A0ABD1WZ46_9LAMI